MHVNKIMSKMNSKVRLENFIYANRTARGKVTKGDKHYFNVYCNLKKKENFFVIIEAGMQ